MSRIGVKPIRIPPEVKLEPASDRVTVTGPKGSLFVDLPKSIKLTQESDLIKISRNSDNLQVKALHGLIRSLVQNAIIGVSKGYEKQLELVGTGYRVKLEGGNLVFSLGFSHPIEFKLIKGIEFSVEKNNIVFIKGIDKHLVGQVAANIRSLRPPESYKGKGIRYSGESVRIKAGKATKGAEK